jgi:hypothetical protein
MKVAKLHICHTLTNISMSNRNDITETAHKHFTSFYWPSYPIVDEDIWEEY